MLRLLLDHFRKVCEPNIFYSLPLDDFQELPGSEFGKILGLQKDRLLLKGQINALTMASVLTLLILEPFKDFVLLASS